MLNVTHFRHEIIRPVLEKLDMWSEAAENLVLGTAIQESNLTHLRQLGGGPARGLYQMEPATEKDIHVYLESRRSILANMPMPEDLVGNLRYATAMCRVHYWRRPEPLPHAEDAEGHAAYWKRHYNTRAGAGRETGFARDFRRYVLQT